jgi:hypothetical protein
MSNPEPREVPDEPIGPRDEAVERDARSFIQKAVGILNDLLEVKVVTAVDTVDVFLSTTDDATATTLKTDKALEKSIVTVVKITDGDVTTVISESLLDNTELRAYHEAQVAKSMQVLPDNLRALVEIARSIIDHVTED